MKDTKKETKLVPKLRFKEFEGEWSSAKISQVVENIGGTALEKYVSPNGNYHFISIGNYSTDGKYKDTGSRVILNEKTKTKLLSKDNLAMVLNDKTASGDIIGSSILVDENDKYIYNQRTERLIVKSGSPKFLWHLLNSPKSRKKIYKISQGGTQIYVNFSSVKKLTLHIPENPEQQKIATFLTAVDKRIEQLTKKKKLLEEYKKGVMQKIFNQEIRFKDENGNDFPDWEENLIENQFRFKQGVQVPIENQFQTPRNENFQRFIRIIDVTQPNSDTRYIEDPGSEHHISDNDIFMIRYGTPGVVAMGYVGVIANNLFRIIPKNKTLCKRFFYYLFKFSEKQFLILSNSTSMPAISFDTLKKLLIKVPSYKEQFNIATFLDEIEKQIEKHQGQITKLSEFKQGLLQQMFI